MKKSIKIGVGSGWAGDRVDAVIDLVNKVDLDYLFFEAMSESTVASTRERMLANPDVAGYDELIADRMDAVLETCWRKGTKILTNQGCANPEGARSHVVRIARELGLDGLKVASVNVNDLGERVLEVGDVSFDTGEPIAQALKGKEIIAAEPYMGADGVVEAFRRGAHVVVTSRMSDNSLALGPILDAFPAWRGDLEKTAIGCAVGHMLECGITGMTAGFMADPPRLEVDGFFEGIGLPYAVVSEDGDVVFEKVPDTGGFLSSLGCRKKLMHEIGDASNYYDPNVNLDLSVMEFEDLEPNRVRMKNVQGKPRPEKLKVNIACREGFMTQDFAFYAGPRAWNRAKLAADLLLHRAKVRDLALDDIRIEFPGINAVFREATPKDKIPDDPWEVCFRFAASAQSRDPLLAILNEFDANGPNGPFGTGKGIPPPDRIRSIVGVTSTLVAREEFAFNVELEEA